MSVTILFWKQFLGCRSCWKSEKSSKSVGKVMEFSVCGDGVNPAYFLRVIYSTWYYIFNVLLFLICVILQVELSSLTAESQSYQEQVSVPLKAKEEQKLLVTGKENR